MCVRCIIILAICYKTESCLLIYDYSQPTIILQLKLYTPCINFISYQILCILSILVGRQSAELLQVYMPWAVCSAVKAKFLLNVYFEQHFSESLDDLRGWLGITFPPPGSLTTV